MAFNWDRECAYNEANKAAFHREARKRLAQLAVELDLPLGSYDLRSNKAGIAGSGEVTLHGLDVYVQVSQSSMGTGRGILYRTCKGRRDYSGGTNNFASLYELDDPRALAARIKRIMPDPLVAAYIEEGLGG
jgi:hypothetical protein